jgi:branched-chain amino acid transport system permease protein
LSFETLIQHIINAIINGSFYGLMGAGFGLILGVTGRFHLAFSTTFLAAAYAASVLNGAGVPLILAILIGLTVSAALGVLIEAVIYRPVVAKSATGGLLAVFVSALGVTILAENLIRLVWGSQAKTLSTGFKNSGLALGGSVSLSVLELVVIVVSWIVVVALWLYLRRSGQGRAIRAVQANPDMARVVGIDPGRVYLLVFVLGSVVCGVGAILYTMRFSAQPDMGLQSTFLALVVAFVAGTHSSPVRFAVAGVAVALIQSISTIWISESWKDVIVFGVLFIYVAVTPLLSGGGRPQLRLPSRRVAAGV